MLLLRRPEGALSVGPVAPVPAEPDPDATDVDSVRARLAARGLVRSTPSVRIRELAGGPDPLAPRRPVNPYKGTLDRGTPPTPAPASTHSVEDPELLEAEPFGPKTVTRCPSCRTGQPVAVDATGYRCGSCDKVWRWAVCGSCDSLSLTIARQESWRCRCGAYSRSWWRTPTALRDAAAVAARKRSVAADQERARILTLARRRRWKVLLAGAVVIVLAGLSALVFTANDAAGPAEATRVTCARWDSLKSALANGSLGGAEIDAATSELAAGAETAASDVQLASHDLADAGRPGRAAFLIASTRLSDACAGAR